MLEGCLSRGAPWQDLTLSERYLPVFHSSIECIILTEAAYKGTAATKKTGPWVMA
jgi:hypothetical protein